MRVNNCVGCTKFPCADVKHECYAIPNIEVKPREVSIIMISEAAPANPGDYYYAKGDSLFQQTTVQAFNDAGTEVKTIRDILDLGVYLTTAVKCGKTGYGIKASTIEAGSAVANEPFFSRTITICLHRKSGNRTLRRPCSGRRRWHRTA